MKFSQYTPVISPNGIGNAVLRSPDLPTERMPGAGRGANAMAAAFGQVGKFLQEKQDEQDAADVMEARNKIMGSLTSQMYGEQGLLTTGVGENAKGLTSRVKEAVQKNFDSVAGRYNGRVRRVLQGNLNENMGNYLRIAAQQEGREFVKQKEANCTSALALNADRIASSYDKPEIIESLMKDSLTLIQYRAVDQGWSGSQFEVEKRLKTTALLGGAVENAIADGNIDTAQSLIDTYGSSMSQEAVMKWQKQIRQESSIKTNREIGEWLAQKYMNDPEGARRYIYETLAQETEYTGGGGPREGSENAWVVYDAFKAAGYDDNAIAGILGRLQQEHNFDTSDIPEHWDVDASGRSIYVGGYGMFQFNGSRTTDFVRWAEEQGLNPQDARTQAKFAVQEAINRGQTPEAMNGMSAEDAATYWTDNYEVGERGGERQFAGEWLKRIKKGSGGSSVSYDSLDDNIDAYGVDLTGTRPETIGMINRADQIHYAMFGTHLWVSCTTGGHADGTPHALGYKADVGSDALTASQENRDKFDAALKAEGIGSNNEYDHRSRGWTGGHFDLDVRGEDWINGTNHGGFKGGSGGSGRTRRKYTESQLSAIWQQYQARVNDRKRAEKAASSQRVEAWSNALMGMSEGDAASYLERIKDQADYQEYSQVLTAYGKIFGRRGGGSGGGGGGGRSGSSSGRLYYTGSSGSRYTANQYEDAKALFDEYEERRNDREDTISRTDQRRYNKAARTINDIEGNSGDDLTSAKALAMARHAVEVNSNDEEAEWYLMQPENGGFTKSEARAYIEMVHGDEEE